MVYSLPYISPLRRAHQAAEAIGAALKMEPVTGDALKEINFGKLDGVTLEDMAARSPDLYARWQDKTDLAFRWPGGEQRGTFFRRVAEVCDRLLARHPDDNIRRRRPRQHDRASLAHLLPDQLGRWWEYGLDNGGLTHVRVTETGRQLLTLNETDHLPT